MPKNVFVTPKSVLTGLWPPFMDMHRTGKNRSWPTRTFTAEVNKMTFGLVSALMLETSVFFTVYFVPSF